MNTKEQILAAIQATLNNGMAAKQLADTLPDEAPAPPPPPPTPTETVFQVKAGDNLQKALEAAAVDTSGKDVRIKVQPGAKFLGNLSEPVKSHNRMVYVEPDFDVQANLGSGRVDSARTDLPIVSPTNTSLGTLTSVRSRGWSWQGIHFDKTGSGRGIVELGDASAVAVSEVAQQHSFKQCRMHGDPVAFQKRGIIANCGALVVEGCDMRNIGYPGADGQCILGYNGPGPFSIVGNYLEGAGENVMFGGGRVMAASMVPSDILIRGNHLPKNSAWLQLATKPLVKNNLELKDAQRVLIEGNLFEYNWTQGQEGGAILFKAAANGEPQAWVRCHHVVFRYNVVRRAGGFLSINNSEGVGPTLGCQDIVIEHNVAYDLGVSTWSGNGHGFRIGGGPDGVQLLHNTLINKHTFVYSWNDPAVDYISGFKAIGNLAREADYGLYGTNVGGQGQKWLDSYAPGYVFTANAFEDNASSAVYPAGHTKLPNGLLTSGGLDAHFKPVDAKIMAVKDADGVMVGADVSKILALFSQYGIAW